MPVILDIPTPPPGLLPDDLARWKRNADRLRRWAQTPKAFRAPAWALERFCRELVHMEETEDMREVGGLLRDFMREHKKNGVSF